MYNRIILMYGGRVMQNKGLSKVEKERITEITERLLTDFGYYDRENTYVDISKLAMSVGFKVGESRKLAFTDDGFIYASKDKDKSIIGVNYDRSIEEKRFIVAHELAHYYLHIPNLNDEDTIMFREHIKGKDETENDADYFAASILMPRKIFKSNYDRLIANGYDLSDIVDGLQLIFKTPRESVKRRIEEVCINGEG